MSHSEPHPPVPEELWMLCAYDGDGTNGRWVDSSVVGLYVVATDERAAEICAMEHCKRSKHICICIPVLVKSAEKPREEQRRPIPTFKPYILPNGDMINLPDVAYVQYHASHTTDATSPLDRPLVVVGMRTATALKSIYTEWQVQMRFDDDATAIKARDAVAAAVMAHAKSQPSQDPTS